MWWRVLVFTHGLDLTGNLHFPVTLESDSVIWLVLAQSLLEEGMHVIKRPRHLIFVATLSFPCGNRGDHRAGIRGWITKLLCGGQAPWKVNSLVVDLHEQETNWCCFKSSKCWGCVFCRITQDNKILLLTLPLIKIGTWSGAFIHKIGIKFTLSSFQSCYEFKWDYICEKALQIRKCYIDRRNILISRVAWYV